MNLMLDEAKRVLENSGVIAFPTETVFGFGVYFDDINAYNLLNQIKRRPEDKPYTMMLSNKEEIEKYAYLTPRDKKIIGAFIPGPITVLLKAKEIVPNHVTHGTGIIGLRVPDMKNIQDLLAFLGKPLLVPSANRSGEKPFLTKEEVRKEFGEEIGYIYPENALGLAPSTIIDLTGDDVKIVREGPLSLEDIRRIL